MTCICVRSTPQHALYMGQEHTPARSDSDEELDSKVMHTCTCAMQTRLQSPGDDIKGCVNDKGDSTKVYIRRQHQRAHQLASGDSIKGHLGERKKGVIRGHINLHGAGQECLNTDGVCLNTLQASWRWLGCSLCQPCVALLIMAMSICAVNQEISGAHTRCHDH